MADIHPIHPHCNHCSNRAANAEYLLIDQVDIIEEILSESPALLDVQIIEDAIRRLLAVHYAAKYIRALTSRFGKPEGA
jgi:hypothetical protein